MPQVRAERLIRLDPETAFAFSQTTGDFRLKWDPFISAQGWLDGASAAGKGVRTRTVSRMGLVMVSEYVSFAPPKNVGMTMVSGPWFFENFGGGWRFTPDDGGTRAVWKYTFSCRPAWLRPVAERIGTWLLGKEINKRIEAFARACEDPELVAEFRALSRHGNHLRHRDHGDGMLRFVPQFHAGDARQLDRRGAGDPDPAARAWPSRRTPGPRRRRGP